LSELQSWIRKCLITVGASACHSTLGVLVEASLAHL
jgi:hypothetical protein